LFADDLGKGIKPGSCSAGKEDCFLIHARKSLGLELHRLSIAAHCSQKRVLPGTWSFRLSFNQPRVRRQTTFVRSMTKGLPRRSNTFRLAMRPPTAWRNEFSMTSNESCGLASMEALKVTPESFFSKTPQTRARESVA